MDIVAVASTAATLVTTSFNLCFHVDYVRASSLVIPYSAVARNEFAFFVLRFMQRRMKLGFTTMSTEGYVFFKRIPNDARVDVSIPRLSDESFKLCRAIVNTLSNAPKSMQSEEVTHAIVASNDAAIKQLRFLVRLYCTKPDLSLQTRSAPSERAADAEAEAEVDAEADAEAGDA